MTRRPAVNLLDENDLSDEERAQARVDAMSQEQVAQTLRPGELTEAETAKIREQAVQQVADEQLKKARDALLAKFLAEERQKASPQTPKPGEEIKYIQIELPLHSDRIMIDGVVYFHGARYGVPKLVYDTMREIIARGHRHENEIKGVEKDNRFRQPRQEVLSGASL